MILVDTSIWIDCFSRSQALDLEEVLDFDEIVTCLPVIQEVLQGFDNQRAYRIARDALFALPVVESPIGDEVFELGIDLYRSARRAGYTIRSGADCLIGACAVRNSLTILHRDRDFDALARIAPLEVRRL